MGNILIVIREQKYLRRVPEIKEKRIMNAIPTNILSQLPPTYSDKSMMSLPGNFLKSLHISRVRPIAIKLINITFSHAEGPEDCMIVSGIFIIIWLVITIQIKQIASIVPNL